ncbi:glycosyltransferase family 4 protein [Pseudorhodobacter sp. W20_MBD10_FR17]|uniref:glycosyltransferase family 4 protein n=1 Tax=Pseudorhodobacter sp. W20_MBD10_FR17 TaxID=3240266 RepID=UPI003F9AA4BE
MNLFFPLREIATRKIAVLQSSFQERLISIRLLISKFLHLKKRREITKKSLLALKSSTKINESAIKENKPEIICVHQGYELYGSDRTFISTLIAFREKYEDAQIVAIIPREGRLSAALLDLDFNVEIENIWVIRKSHGLLGNTYALLRLPFRVARAWLRIRKARFHYINTSVILDYSLASRFASNPGFLHIHEIASHNVTAVLRSIARISGAFMLFNSQATKLGMRLDGDVVLNGVPGPSKISSLAARKGSSHPVRILMIGRVNRWKGQDLLLEAIANLPIDIASAIEVLFVGDAFEGGPEMTKLKELVNQLNLRCSIKIEGFVDSPSEIYRWSDIVIIPSKTPEPFGLVATEAMSHARPTISAQHGGLLEITVHEETGLFFTPNDVCALSLAIQRLVVNESERIQFGENGRIRYLTSFTEETYKNRLTEVIEKRTSKSFRIVR